MQCEANVLFLYLLMILHIVSVLIESTSFFVKLKFLGHSVICNSYMLIGQTYSIMWILTKLKPSIDNWNAKFAALLERD